MTGFVNVAGLVLLLVAVLWAVAAGLRGERGRQRMEAGIVRDTRDTFVLAAADDACDEVDQ